MIMIDLRKDQVGLSQSEQTDEYAFAANLLYKEKKDKYAVVDELVKTGIDAESVKIIVNKLISPQNKDAERDVLHGFLWCAAGTAATIADIGYIFWGAIVFGAIQFLKGLINLARLERRKVM